MGRPMGALIYGSGCGDGDGGVITSLQRIQSAYSYTSSIGPIMFLVTHITHDQKLRNNQSAHLAVVGVVVVVFDDDDDD